MSQHRSTPLGQDGPPPAPMNALPPELKAVIVRMIDEIDQAELDDDDDDVLVESDETEEDLNDVHRRDGCRHLDPLEMRAMAEVTEVEVRYLNKSLGDEKGQEDDGKGPDSPEKHDQASNMHNMCLVSQEWAALCQPYIWKNVDLRTIRLDDIWYFYRDILPRYAQHVETIAFDTNEKNPEVFETCQFHGIHPDDAKRDRYAALKNDVETGVDGKTGENGAVRDPSEVEEAWERAVQGTLGESTRKRVRIMKDVLDQMAAAGIYSCQGELSYWSQLTAARHALLGKILLSLPRLDRLIFDVVETRGGERYMDSMWYYKRNNEPETHILPVLLEDSSLGGRLIDVTLWGYGDAGSPLSGNTLGRFLRLSPNLERLALDVDLIAPGLDEFVEALTSLEQLKILHLAGTSWTNADLVEATWVTPLECLAITDADIEESMLYDFLRKFVLRFSASLTSLELGDAFENFNDLLQIQEASERRNLDRSPWQLLKLKTLTLVSAPPEFLELFSTCPLEELELSDTQLFRIEHFETALKTHAATLKKFTLRSDHDLTFGEVESLELIAFHKGIEMNITKADSDSDDEDDDDYSDDYDEYPYEGYGYYDNDDGYEDSDYDSEDEFGIGGARAAFNGFDRPSRW